MMTEQTIAAREAKNHFGQLLDTAQKTPITIEKKGKPIAVVISLDEYKHLKTGVAKSHKTTDFKKWLGYAKKVPVNPHPRFSSDDDLWREKEEIQ